MNTSVMLVGRNTPFMETLYRSLAFADFTFFFVQSATEALDMIQNNDIEVAVLNMHDLEGDGLRLLESIKKARFITEVITLTMPSAIQWSIKSMKLGAFADLLIPFDNEDLVEKMREAADTKRAKGKKGKSLFEKFEDAMVSATFAEVGEADTAREMFKEGHRREPIKKEDNN